MTNKLTKLVLYSTILLTTQLKAQIVLQALDGYTPPPYQVPAEVTIGNGKKFFASIYDVDYIPYNYPTAPATWNTNVAADGTNETTVDYQGTITETGVAVIIPITATGNTTIPAFSTTTTVDTYKTQDGIGRTIELSWQQQTVTAATKYITGKLRTTSGTLNIKKLDINAGVGNDNQGVELANFTYPATANSNTTHKFEVRAIAGIPDRYFGKNTRTFVGYGALEREHDFLYVPITGPDGKTWLNNNLGAEYSNIHSPHFNPATQAGGDSTNPNDIKRDWKAYGSLFQHSRKPDGHELINWTSPTTGTPKYGMQTDFTVNWIPNNNKFIYGHYSWTNDYYSRLWEGYDAAHNPCPVGYGVPDVEVLNDLREAISGSSASNGDLWDKDIIVRFPAPGYRYFYNGHLYEQSSNGYYWAGNASAGNRAVYLTFDQNNSYAGPYFYIASGINVRCVQY